MLHSTMFETFKVMVETCSDFGSKVTEGEMVRLHLLSIRVFTYIHDSTVEPDAGPSTASSSQRVGQQVRCLLTVQTNLC